MTNVVAMTPKGQGPDPELMKNQVKCAECGFEGHVLHTHVLNAHAMSPEDYAKKHPGSKMLSPLGEQILAKELRRPDAAIEYKVTDVDSMAVFKIGFGKGGGTPKPIRAYEGFNFEHGVPLKDDHYVFPKDLTRDMLMGIMAGGLIYITGPTGCGKTSIYEQIAARTGRPFFRQQFHGEMEPAELTGTWIVNEHQTFEYMYSGLAKAIQLPTLVVFDEFDSGTPVVTAIANGLLEGKPLVLNNKGGEKIYPHKDCILVATGNTNGMGDDTGLYTSTTVQSFATMNRYRMFLNMDYIAEEDEIAMLKSRFPKIPENTIGEMVKVANMIRAGFKEGKITAVISTRQLVNWGMWLTMNGEPGRSFKLAFQNQLSKMDSDVVAQLYQRVFASR
jgi:cobaltochelatase CobS